MKICETSAEFGFAGLRMARAQARQAETSREVAYAVSELETSPSRRLEEQFDQHPLGFMTRIGRMRSHYPDNLPRRGKRWRGAPRIAQVVEPVEGSERIEGCARRGAAANLLCDFCVPCDQRVLHIRVHLRLRILRNLEATHRERSPLTGEGPVGKTRLAAQGEWESRPLPWSGARAKDESEFGGRCNFGWSGKGSLSALSTENKPAGE